MAISVSICYWLYYSNCQIKLSFKSENCADSDRVIICVHNIECEHIEGVAQASMRDE